MRIAVATLICLLLHAGAWGQSSTGPTDPKAQKSFAKGQAALKAQQYDDALSDFKKADKQDGGTCVACQEQIVDAALSSANFKAAQSAAQALIAEAKTPLSASLAHYDYGKALLREATMNIQGLKANEDLFPEADREFKLALASTPNFPAAMFSDGVALAHMHQNAEARTQFLGVLSLTKGDTLVRKRASRYVIHPELAAQTLAPIFSVKTLDGQEINPDDLTGKVVLIDFWATWCGPCREALPHIQKLATEFRDEPFVDLSVSLDADEAKWKSFVESHNMTWLQYRDGGFHGPVATQFAVNEIPSTFTIDADGVLADQKPGDVETEGNLKKLFAHAREEAESPKAGQ